MNPNSIHDRFLSLLGAKNFMPVCFISYIALRIAVLFVHPLQPTSDFLWYYERAAEIASGSGYAQGGVLTAFWPVGWPGLLGGLFIVTGTSALAGQIANLVFAVLVFALTATVGTAFFRDHMVGRAAVLLLTLFPNQIAYVPLLSTEIFYEFLLLICVWLLMQERLAPAIFAGLLFGVATLTKAQSLFLPGFLMLGVFLSAPSHRAFNRLIRLTCVVYVMTLLAVAPWTYRNYTVFGAFIPVSTNGGLTLLTGNNPQATGGFTPETPLAQGLSHDPADQVTTDRLARLYAFDWIEKNPGRFLLLMPKKLFWLWAPDGEAEYSYQNGFAYYAANVALFRTVRVLNQAYYFLLLLLALPAIWLLLRRRAAASPWAGAGLSICVYFSAISMVFSGQSRFHFSLMPFVAIYAGWTLVRASMPGRNRAAGLQSP